MKRPTLSFRQPFLASSATLFITFLWTFLFITAKTGDDYYTVNILWYDNNINYYNKIFFFIFIPNALEATANRRTKKLQSWSISFYALASLFHIFLLWKYQQFHLKKAETTFKKKTLNCIQLIEEFFLNFERNYCHWHNKFT